MLDLVVGSLQGVLRGLQNTLSAALLREHSADLLTQTTLAPSFPVHGNPERVVSELLRAACVAGSAQYSEYYVMASPEESSREVPMLQSLGCYNHGDGKGFSATSSNHITSSGLLAEVIQSKQPWLGDSLDTSDPRPLWFADRPDFGSEISVGEDDEMGLTRRLQSQKGSKRVICIPLVCSRRHLVPEGDNAAPIIGLLVVERTKASHSSDGSFSDDEIRLLLQLASQASVSMKASEVIQVRTSSSRVPPSFTIVIGTSNSSGRDFRRA